MEEQKLIRNCPQCGCDIIYKSIYVLNKANKNKNLCKNCAKAIRNKQSDFKRNCPQCGKEIFYKDQNALDYAIKQNKICHGCSIKNNKNEIKPFKRNCPQCNKEIFYKNENICKKAEIKKTLCGKCTRKIIFNKEELKEKFRKQCSGQGNPMYGKSTYDVWLQKYGKEEADKRQQQMIEKCRKASSGENNPMFGKPSPKKSGNGWSGYYQNHYFRSILELHYLIYLLDNNIKFESGEKRKHIIQYEMDGIKRNYFPDYYLSETDQIIEIKPKKLINSYENKLKFSAAKNKLGNRHIIITEDKIVKIDLQRLYNMYIDKEIIFDKGYDIKFEEYYNKIHNM